MKCSNWFRQIAPLIPLIGSLLLVSCSDGPGPISPINPTDKLASSKKTPDQSTASTVRPVTRLESSALAKNGYNNAKALQQLQEVRDELKAIVDNNPCTAVADKLSRAVKKANGAVAKLSGTSSDDNDDDDENGDHDGDGDRDQDDKAIKKINKAKVKIQEAINTSLLTSTHGGQFISQLAAVENQIRTGVSPSDDHRGASKSLWIRRNYGGLISLCGHSIKIPKYATKQDALFSINVSPTGYVTVDFGPDGSFDKDVTVTISYKEANLTGIDPTKLTLAWYDESSGHWINLGGTVNLVQKVVTALTRHFTQYTISTK